VRKEVATKDVGLETEKVLSLDTYVQTNFDNFGQTSTLSQQKIGPIKLKIKKLAGIKSIPGNLTHSRCSSTSENFGLTNQIYEKSAIRKAEENSPLETYMAVRNMDYF
jgi:hypothetical protein